MNLERVLITIKQLQPLISYTDSTDRRSRTDNRMLGLPQAKGVERMDSGSLLTNSHSLNGLRDA